MPYKPKQLLLALCASLLVGQANSQIDFPFVESNVSYSSVTKLEYRSADKLLHYGEEPYQFGRLWLPTSSDNPADLIAFIHGGCWLNQFDMAHTYPAATALAQAGYAVWSLEYRRIGDPGGGWPGSYNDIKDGIHHISNLSEFGVKTDNIVIVGHSAGGHLGLLAGVDFPALNAVIGLAAITDIEKYAAGTNDCETATELFMGATVAQASELYQTANPAKLDLHSQTLLLYGAADSIVKVSQSVLPNARKSGLEEAGHFDWVHPGTEAFQLLLDSLGNLF